MALTLSQRATIRKTCIFVVVTNTIVFLLLAVFGKISNTSDTIVFIDFWGRLTVYSFWFLAFACYERMFVNLPIIRRIIIFALIANVPFFLAMAYFDRLPGDPVSAVMVDFWGRLTVYSLWFMAYLTFNRYVSDQPAHSQETI